MIETCLSGVASCWGVMCHGDGGHRGDVCRPAGTALRLPSYDPYSVPSERGKVISRYLLAIVQKHARSGVKVIRSATGTTRSGRQPEWIVASTSERAASVAGGDP